MASISKANEELYMKRLTVLVAVILAICCAGLTSFAQIDNDMVQKIAFLLGEGAAKSH